MIASGDNDMGANLYSAHVQYSCAGLVKLTDTRRPRVAVTSVTIQIDDVSDGIGLITDRG